jgi:hypothetical protein
VARDWETWLGTASGPASATEEQERDRTEGHIREAIRASADLPRNVRVYIKGSYANGTNVRRDADVDVAVEWTNTFKVDTWGKTAGMPAAELGYTPVDEPLTPKEFRRRVERALVDALGSQPVDTSPDKHIGVAGTNNTLDADVVPCFALNRYDAPRVAVPGHRIFPKSGGYVDNFPKQCHENGVTKNAVTRHRYKEIVRCVKRLVGELYDERVIPRDYPGYLLECLVYNVPNNRFGNARRYDDMQGVFAYLWNGLRDESVHMAWTEPSELVMLFRGHSNRIPANAFNVVDKAWDRIGVQ